MLTTLRIKNLALVADLTLELGAGYNVITGETGAGKSMLIGALNLILGERADRGLIRSGAESCSVEACFDARGIKAPLAGFLEENGLEPCEDHQLVLKRTFAHSGSNRQFINGSPASLGALGTIGEWLVDIHGPHEHQSLLHPARQLELLDAFGHLESERERFAALARERSRLHSEKAALIVDERTYAQQLDLLRFQASEISAACFHPDEEQQVEQEHGRAGNAARLIELCQEALAVLADNENALLNQAGSVGRALQELQKLDGGAGGLTALHEQALCSWRELQTELSRYAEKIEVDPARLASLEERMNLIHSLKRKYGATLPEVIAFGAEAQRKLETLQERDAELARLNDKLARNQADLLSLGRDLTGKRRKAIPQLSKAVSKQLNDLGFKQSRFDVALTTEQPSPVSREAEPSPGVAGGRINHSGLDAVEFQFAPNPGEPARPLRSIASSGELARVMLAIKTVLAVEDLVPVLVFDEVDANVGGETAHAVGEKMRQIARNRQVLCITHLPQVAAPASAHYVANKHIKEGRTVSEITLLPPEARVREIARMLGGQSEAARKHAEALLK